VPSGSPPRRLRIGSPEPGDEQECATRERLEQMDARFAERVDLVKNFAGVPRHGFTTLSDDEERELHRLSHKEALKCEEAKAFLAGSVLVASALETLLILMVNCYPEEAELTGPVPMRKGVRLPL
jgi:hypothetical protein